MSRNPLDGKTIVLMRQKNSDTESGDDVKDDASLEGQLSALGADILFFPTIETSALANNISFFFLSYLFDDFSWIFFTSKNGVRHFFETIKKYDNYPELMRKIAEKKIAVIGASTAGELKKYA